MIRRPPRSTLSSSSAASDVYKRQHKTYATFAPVKGKYTLIERSHDDDDDKAEGETKGAKAEELQYPDSKLAEPVQQLMRLIFDMDMMASHMKQLGYDAKKMPLGKMSKATVTKGYQILKKISELFEEGAKAPPRAVLEQLSSEFYTLIPHDFGFQKMSNFVISTKKILKDKCEMVESLADIAVASELLSGKVDTSHNPVDTNYGKLHCGLEPVPKHTSEFQLVKEYVANTHAKTHNAYTLQLQELFRVEKEGEAETFGPFSEAPNRKLLWHGSRLTNWTGILSSGLRIAPPEAPVTGYMFDKGVYFADMVSKSANYCFTSKTNPTGLMLLCEVALGDECELLRADYHAASTMRAAGKQSVKGVGATAPDPKGDVVLENGCLVPAGKGVTGSKPGDLLYNEFIVYNTNQVKMKYLLRLNFQHNALSKFH
eukprot:TRINITY_DN49081_c0_g1_i1.p1 TRINITY_DN49081_c0_g1~~TRINITY_DN49081_c0_g1_i1.p1  ORF type:complete len:429 (-),score=130.16 TRINITY_DN49081_c0_g1_i1:185-1471(-)